MRKTIGHFGRFSLFSSNATSMKTRMSSTTQTLVCPRAKKLQLELQVISNLVNGKVPTINQDSELWIKSARQRRILSDSNPKISSMMSRCKKRIRNMKTKNSIAESSMFSKYNLLKANSSN